MKKKTNVLLIFIALILIILGSFFALKDSDTNNKKDLINNIKSHYNKYVITSKDTKLYNNKYKSIGIVHKNKKLILDSIKINKNTKYFKIKDTDNYIKYSDVEKYKHKINIDNRYKKYIVFNENITTNKKVKLYQDNKLIYTINNSLDLPIMRKEEDGYYVEFNNELYLVKNEDIVKTYNKNNTDSKEALEVPVTVYHFIYLDGEVCGEIICHHSSQIEEEFNYLNENSFFTINTKEMEWFIDKRIRLPEKSILVTIDDGARAEKFIPFLEKYKINATLFLVTSWYEKSKFKSPYLEIASHSDNLHEGGKCPGDQGSPLKCLDKNELLKDLKTSRDKLDGTEAFCYPFYEFNDYSESVLKEAGFKSAYIGGMQKAKQGINKYRIPRITIMFDNTLEDYKKYIN
ncbi:MAG: polysaccharide deacetylase family protein [Bacilli bacterium]|nr:polysaccharide deacetylase family protein [Bacilli bacterium]